MSERTSTGPCRIAQGWRNLVCRRIRVRQIICLRIRDRFRQPKSMTITSSRVRLVPAEHDIARL